MSEKVRLTLSTTNEDKHEMKMLKNEIRGRKDHASASLYCIMGQRNISSGVPSPMKKLDN